MEKILPLVLLCISLQVKAQDNIEKSKSVLAINFFTHSNNSILSLEIQNVDTVDHTFSLSGEILNEAYWNHSPLISSRLNELKDTFALIPNHTIMPLQSITFHYRIKGNTESKEQFRFRISILDTDKKEKEKIFSGPISNYSLEYLIRNTNK